MKRIGVILLVMMFLGSTRLNAQNKSYVIKENGRRLDPVDMNCPSKEINNSYGDFFGVKVSKFFRLSDNFGCYIPKMKRHYMMAISSTVMQYSLNYDEPIPSIKCPNQKSKRLLIITSSKNKTTGYVINEIGDDIVLDFDGGGHDPYVDSGDDGVDGFTLNFSFGTIYKYEYEVHIKITDKGVFVTEVVGAKYRSDGRGLAKNIDKKFPMVEQNRISKITKKQIYLLGF